MRAVIIILFIIIFAFIQPISFAQIQEKDKAIFEEKKPGFYQNEIMKSIKELNAVKKQPGKRLTVNISKYDLPNSVNEFKSFWHNNPVSQGNTGTCWSFATTSFFESEVYRLTNRKVKLSEMFTVYWEYVEKAREFVKTRGKSLFAQGSEANAVTRIWKKYGIVPEKDYPRVMPGQKFPNHSKMFNEMHSYLKSVKLSNAWNEDFVLETIKSILNNYIGIPPSRVEVDGKFYTPKKYLSDYLKLKLNDYVDILSYMQKPYFQQVEYTVPDNWWHSKDYYNIPLDDFTQIVKSAIRKGFTMSIGGDVSEPGRIPEKDVFIIPTFDIPSEYIDENARQFRFSNKTTTDDHGIHLVGYMEKNGKDWYLIKDSGSSSRDGNNKGYYFMSSDYLKLKIMDFMIHKDAVRNILKKFK